MKKNGLLLLSILCCFSGFAQQKGIVKGLLYDTAAHQPVAVATITLLQQKDSSLVTFAMTDYKGQFELKLLPDGNYRLMISHVNYHTVNRFFTIDESRRTKDFDTLVLHDLSKMLDEVVVTADAPPVTLIGDTVQYHADAFKVQPNSNVEQLLRKMPGIKIDKDGTVKAQGQEVKRVLVDGKEFFGTDPKIATRNLPADAVEKVQVYDRMSDAAQLTGFDDGNSEKTINLKLKKDKKKGLFGKVTAGGGTQDRYEGRFNVNSFKGARQLSVIGMGNNTNAEGFSFMDMLNFTGELNRLQRGGNGSPNISINDNDANGMQGNGANNTGIRTIWGGGINYNNIIGNNTDFASNYFYNRYNPTKESTIQRQYFLPDSSYFYNQQAQTSNLNNSHRLNLSADIKLDSFHSLKIIPSFGFQQVRNSNRSIYATRSQEQQLTNEGYSNNTTNSEGYNFRNDLLFRKRFRLKGRTFSLSLQTSLNNSTGDGSLLSVNQFYNSTGNRFRNDSIKQQNTTEGDLGSYNARAVYTEPLFRRSLLEFSVGNNYSVSTAQKVTYDFNNANGKFDRRNNRLSNDFENTYGYTTAGLRLRSKYKKLTVAAGANWQQAGLKGKIITNGKDSLISKTFINVLPNARLQYNFTRYRNFTLNYAAQTNQPSISQLQPVPDISDPLNIREGNPDLKQEYSHALQVNYMSVNPFLNKSMFAFFTIRETQNSIVNSDTIDSLGIKRTRPVNVNGVLNINGNISIGRPVRFLKGSVDIGTDIGYKTGKQFINGAGNNIKTLSLGPNLRLDMNPTNKLSIALLTNISYNDTRYSLQAGLNARYLRQEYGTEINWQLPAGFYFNTDFTYLLNNRQQAAGFNTRVPLWNAAISKQFLRYNRGEMKLSAYDLLKQNVGISRSTNQNYIEDSRTKNLQRFFMLSFTYSLSKSGLAQAPGAGNMRIIRR